MPSAIVFLRPLGLRLEDRAAFWIQLRGRFVHIEYVALRDAAGAYLGCLEVTEDLTAKRALGGEQRLLSWSD